MSGISHFKDHATLHMPGRGYLKNDTLKIRAIVRLDAVAKLGPEVDSSAQHGLGLAGAAASLFMALNYSAQKGPRSKGSV